MSKTTREMPAARDPLPSANEPTVSFFEDALRLRTLLVPIDYSTESYRALEFALPLAKRFGATVRLLHVYEGAHQFSSVSPALWSEAEFLQRLVEDVAARSGFHPQTSDCHIRMGTPFREISAAAQELKADLIVIATHGHSGFQHLMLGSTTEKVVRHAPCPVLVVRERTRGPIKTAPEGIVFQKILVPVDFSACAKEGARYAAAFAAQVGADLRLLHIVHPPDSVVAEGIIAGPTSAELVETALLEAEDKLDEMINFLPLDGISAEPEVGVGPPVETLTEVTKRPDIDLVITSTHGYSGLRHALLGSTAEKLLRQAYCPVLIVPSHCRQIPT